MTLRSISATLAVSAFLLAGTIGSAPAPDPRLMPPGKPRTLPGAPSKLPNVSGEKTKNLDFLFGALKAAPDEDSAKAVEAKIWAVWTATSSDTAALLMLRAKTAMDRKEMD